jgi:hypothetical protein
MIFDQKPEDAGILSEGTGKIWYKDLVGGLDHKDKSELPRSAVFGLEMKSTFVINTQIYLQWYYFFLKPTIALTLEQIANE